MPFPHHCPSLSAAIFRYRRILIQLEAEPTPFEAKAVLRLLQARDRVQETLSQVPDPSPLLLSELAELDRRLDQQKANIARLPHYAQWQKSFLPPDSAWWWHFPLPARSWWERLDWLWNGLTLVFSAISLSLIIDGVPRFLSGGLDTASVFAIIIPSLLALLTSGSLTSIGREARNYLFQKMPSSIGSLLTTGLALLLAFCLIMIHQFYFDDLAIYFNQQGKQLYLKGYWEQSLSNFKKAIAFNPSYAQAHYHLGLLYEDWQKFESGQVRIPACSPTRYFRESTGSAPGL